VLRHLIVEGDLTAYGPVNAVTHYSKEVTDYDRATDFEALGGKFIELPASDPGFGSSARPSGLSSAAMARRGPQPWPVCHGEDSQRRQRGRGKFDRVCSAVTFLVRPVVASISRPTSTCQRKRAVNCRLQGNWREVVKAG
jgi:hypothetical protein